MSMIITRQPHRSRGETTTPDLEQQLAGWSRAFEQLGRGFLSSGMAQIDLARSLCRPASSAISRPGGGEVDRNLRLQMQ